MERKLVRNPLTSVAAGVAVKPEPPLTTPTLEGGDKRVFPLTRGVAGITPKPELP